MQKNGFDEFITSEVEAKRSIKNLLSLLHKGNDYAASFFFEQNSAVGAPVHVESTLEKEATPAELNLTWYCTGPDNTPIYCPSAAIKADAGRAEVLAKENASNVRIPIAPKLLAAFQKERIITIEDWRESDAYGLMVLRQLTGSTLPVHLIPVLYGGNIYGLFVVFGMSSAVTDGLELQRMLALVRSLEQIIKIVRTNKSVMTQTAEFSNSFTSKLINNCSHAVVTVDSHFTITLCNPAAEKMFELEAREIVGESLEHLVPVQQIIPSIQLQSSAHPAGAAQHDQPFTWQEIQGKRGGGELFLMNITAFTIQRGAQTYLTLLLEDLTQCMIQSREYQNSLLKFQVLTNLAPVAIVQVDNEWSSVYVNDQWCEFSGLNKDESSGTHWVNGIHYDDVTSVLVKLKCCVEQQESFKHEFRLITPLGKSVWVSGEAKSLYDSEGNVTGLLLCMTDIESRLQQEYKLKVMAEVDSLTQLGNRLLFTKRLEAAFERDSIDSLAIFLIDLDGFKKVNDTLGHDAGDCLLQKVAERLKSAVRHTDLVCRLGGDEFTILLDRYFHAENVIKIAQNIIKALSEPVQLINRQYYITASVGIAVSDEKVDSATALLKQADIAMYHAKASGKNTFRFYSEVLNSRMSLEMLLDNHIHSGLLNNEFYAVYQPIIGSDEQVIGYEALMRWRHEAFRKISPEKFVPRMEEVGVINKAFMQVFEKVIADYSKLLSLQTRPAYLAVNLSPAQFHDETVLEFILEKLEQSRFPAHLLVIEITEGSLLEASSSFNKMLKTLKPMGVRFALDDFGTGYSSFVYLKKYPIDIIKIDRSFTAHCDRDLENQSILNAMVQLAHNLNLRVVAEGVENKRQLSLLKTLGSDAFQGYHFGKPMSTYAIQKLFYPHGADLATDDAEPNVGVDVDVGG